MINLPSLYLGVNIGFMAAGVVVMAVNFAIKQIIAQKRAKPQIPPGAAMARPPKRSNLNDDLEGLDLDTVEQLFKQGN